MGLFSRQQGRQSTARAMSRFSAADREAGMDLLEMTEAVFVELGAPAQLGTVMVDVALASMGFDTDGDDLAYKVALGPVTFGYACRLASPVYAVPEGTTDMIRACLKLDGDGDLDYEAMADDGDAFGELLSIAARIADNPDIIATLAGISMDAWNAFITVSTFQIHRNLVSNGLSKRSLPREGSIATLLRLGYAIRIVDEVAGADPVSKVDLGLREPGGDGLVYPRPDDDDEGLRLAFPRNDGAPATAPIDVEQWMTDTSGVCTLDFEPYAEHLLEILGLDLIEVIPIVDVILGERPNPDDIDDEVVAALASVRFGYALRNRELQMLGQSTYIASEDPIADMLEERWGNPGAHETAVICQIVQDIAVLGLSGGFRHLSRCAPGATAESRDQAIVGWADRHHPGESLRTGRDITVVLQQCGYTLHRLFEIFPDPLAEE